MTFFGFLVFIGLYIAFCTKKVHEKANLDLSAAPALTDAIKIRKKAQTKRLLFFMLGFVVLAIPTLIMVFFLYSPENVHNKSNIFVVFIVLAIVLVIIALVTYYNKKIGLYYELLGNVNTHTFDDFCKSNNEEPFILYLRNFGTDSYHTKEKMKNKKSHFFSEYETGKALKNNGLRFYAVGNPTELDCSYGADKIYCDFLKWKEQVKYLISQSYKTLVLVNDSDSCLWEIQTLLKDSKEKGIYIFENPEVYHTVKELVSVEGDSLVKFPCYLNNGIFVPFENRKEDYVRLAGDLSSK